MSGSGGVSIARSAVRGENRFYNPPPIRRLQEQEAELQRRREHRLKEQNQRREEEEIRIKMVESRPVRKEPLTCSSGLKEMDAAATATGSHECGLSEGSESGRVASQASNLDRFLEHTTPVVPGRSWSLTSTKENKSHESECQSYFILEDFWESFAEWSVYGVGVPLLLNNSDYVVQYYVPYLSGIQLYVDPTKHSPRHSEETFTGSFKDTAKSNNGDVHIQSFNRLSLKEESFIGVSRDEGDITNSPGRLVYEYLEREGPFVRQPLANKVSVLASGFPELMTYRSCDLLPSSWISVAWYPICRIPVGPTLQNIDACFLTYHLFSNPSQSTGSIRESNHSGLSVKLQLPTFGLASYKLKASIWNPNEAENCQKAISLLQAADNWLKHLQVNHPDYAFFMSHNPHMR